MQSKQKTVKVVTRAIQPKDIPSIKQLIDATWDWSSLTDNSIVLDATLGIYLGQVLQDGTFGRVATINKQTVGFIFGSAFKESPCLQYLMDSSMHNIITLLNAPKDTRDNVIKIFTGLQNTYKQLISGKEQSYDGTLDLFAVSGSAQGNGVGKKLYHELQQYFKSKKVKKYYVYTDTDCNFGFYDHSGFDRVAQKPLTIDFKYGKWTVDIFLYEKMLYTNGK